MPTARKGCAPSTVGWQLPTSSDSRADWTSGEVAKQRMKAWARRRRAAASSPQGDDTVCKASLVPLRSRADTASAMMLLAHAAGSAGLVKARLGAAAGVMGSQPAAAATAVLLQGHAAFQAAPHAPAVQDQVR